MFHKFSVSVILIFFVVAQFSCANFSKAQMQQKSNTNTRFEQTVDSSEEAKVEVEVEKLDINNYDGESISNFPAPKIWLTFSSQDKESNNFRLEIPFDTRMAVQEYWKESLKFKYKYLIQKFPDANTQYQESNKFSDSTGKLIDILKSAPIEFPKGKRNISGNEASDIVRSINIEAANIIKKLETNNNGIKLVN